MTILFLSYWGVQEGLSQSTVLPHVAILARHARIAKVILMTIERERFSSVSLPENVTHIPLISRKNANVFTTKFRDFTTFPRQIIDATKEHGVKLIICRSSMAGALGYLVWKKTKIPYAVESFEPHAAYMRESKIWRAWDPRYWIQRHYERVQKKTATWILPVSFGYSEKLIQEGVPSQRVITVPCCLNVYEFAWSAEKRHAVRMKLAIDEKAVVGIYVGKLGGIYYDEEAFHLFRAVQNHFGDSFNLIILTDHEKSTLLRKCENAGLRPSTIHIQHVQRKEVVSFLSAADFGFSFYKRTPSKRFLSPIKIGEYWANGLPVLIEDGIGDDADIVQREGGGLLYDMRALPPDFSGLEEMLRKGRSKLAAEISEIAKKHRDIGFVENAYARILADF